MAIQLNIGGDNARSKFKAVPTTIDWDKLPQASKDFIVRYGLKQYLADGTVKAETQAQYAEAISARVKKLNDADFSRTVGQSGPTDDPETEGRRLAHNDVLDFMKENGIKADKDAVKKASEAQFTAKRDDYVARGEAAIKARKASAKAIVGDANEDVLKALGIKPKAKTETK